MHHLHFFFKEMSLLFLDPNAIWIKLTWKNVADVFFSTFVNTEEKTMPLYFMGVQFS